MLTISTHQINNIAKLVGEGQEGMSILICCLDICIILFDGSFAVTIRKCVSYGLVILFLEIHPISENIKSLAKDDYWITVCNSEKFEHHK